LLIIARDFRGSGRSLAITMLNSSPFFDVLERCWHKDEKNRLAIVAVSVADPGAFGFHMFSEPGSTKQ